MSEEKITLALAFLQTHPDSAAATLEQHHPLSVARFLAGIPLSYAAPVIQHMLPNYASELCNSLSREVTLGIFSHLETGPVVAILRHMTEDQQVGFLKELPAKSQFACSLLLNYSDEFVGAWITPKIATISHDCTVGEALDFLKSSQDVVHADFIYVVNRDRELLGRTRLVDLLKAKRKMSVINLTETCNIMLSGRSRIEKAVLHEGWRKYHEIPVLNRKQKFIGVLRQVDLRKALDRLAPEVDSQNLPSSFVGLGILYGESLRALFDSLKKIVETDIRS